MRQPDEPIIYNHIAVLRTERGLSRQELAQALDMNYQDLGYLEQEKYNPSLDLALRIGEFFGVPIEEIFSRIPFEPQERIL
jgi:putative transcriptional regulator